MLTDGPAHPMRRNYGCERHDPDGRPPLVLTIAVPARRRDQCPGTQTPTDFDGRQISFRQERQTTSRLRLKPARQLGITGIPVMLCDAWTSAGRSSASNNFDLAKGK